MARVRERDGIDDPDPEGSERSDLRPEPRPQEAVFPYVEAKTVYLQSKRILVNAEESLSKARMDFMIEMDPVKIEQRAETPVGKAPWRLSRLWTRLVGG